MGVVLAVVLEVVAAGGFALMVRWARRGWADAEEKESKKEPDPSNNLQPLPER